MTTKQGWSATYSIGITGIENNHDISDRFRIYPNPVKDKLILHFVSEQNNPVEFRMMNLTGQMLLKETFSSVAIGNTKEIKLDGYQPGIYLVQLTDRNETYTQRIVVE